MIPFSRFRPSAITTFVWHEAGVRPTTLAILGMVTAWVMLGVAFGPVAHVVRSARQTERLRARRPGVGEARSSPARSGSV